MRLPRDYYRSFISPQRFIWLALTNPRLAGPGLKVALAAVRMFFLPQFQTAIFRTRPVVYVDHPVDRAIPFQPSVVSLYMSFIPLWMNAVFWLNRRYGRAADALLADFLESIALLYDEAGSIYLRCHSTTVRPKRLPNLSCAMIQVLDPHLNCIPSLHVTIVFGAWMLARGVVDAMGDTGRDAHAGTAADESRAEAWLASLYDHARRIAETTMLMKQHSVNCVGASLWYLNARFPASFDEARCAAIMSGLFTIEGQDVPVKEEARARVREVFALLKQYAAGGGDWRRPLLGFIQSFPETPPDFR
ncbi:MAG: hypothetical protein RBT68_01880 [Spirochaetia bacterium]|nr:hypothetical protein [Spirochaetia bacterium]